MNSCTPTRSPRFFVSPRQHGAPKLACRMFKWIRIFTCRVIYENSARRIAVYEKLYGRIRRRISQKFTERLALRDHRRISESKVALRGCSH